MHKVARQFLASLAIVASIGCSAARAQYNQPELGSLNKVMDPLKPGEVGVDEKLGAMVPTSLQFVDESGAKVSLSDYLGHDRPIILWMGYYECPMLCDKMSGGMVEAMKHIQLDAGKEFAVLNVSIDPNESASLARAKKVTYLKELGQPGNAAAWNLLTGSPDSIKALASAVGFKFKKLEQNGETTYAHPAVLMVLSPEGKVTRYLYPLPAAGVQFDAQTMRLSLIEASEGRVGSIVDRVFLTCLHYDSTTGKYTKDAVRIMQLGGALTILIMGAFLVPLWVRAARGKDRQNDPKDRLTGGKPVTV